MRKERIDVLLVEQGLVATREQAKRLVMAGVVYCGTEVMDKPGTKISVDACLFVKGALHPFVSRGGVKLAHALEVFDVSLKDHVVIDVGASTGGFTDCALQNGAAHVYAVDVGYGQLAWSLRSDPRVTVMERLNFRHVLPTAFPIRPTAGVMDVSFISIHKLLPKLHDVLVPDASVICLVKPQFEAGPSAVGKGGIVRDPRVHEEVLYRAVSSATEDGFCVQALVASPIRGGEGNVEFLLWLKSNIGPSLVSQEQIREIVALTHDNFQRNGVAKSL